MTGFSILVFFNKAEKSLFDRKEQCRIKLILLNIMIFTDINN